ncbi:MAG TPA: DNA ligase D [Flavisolibacter sp.]|nr:DNA ligase D [Flavisolibacter sp.]
MKSRSSAQFKLSQADKSLLKKGKASAIPVDLQPMLASLVTEPVKEQGWLYEMKWDGYRALVYIENGMVTIRSRNNKSFNEKFYPLTNRFQNWNINAVFDGEIVVVNDEGVPDFGALQLWRSEADGHLFFYAFDVLWMEGRLLMHLPVEERRQLLKAIMPVNDPVLRTSESLENKGDKAFEEARKLHLEGVMAKRMGSIYVPGQRSKDWLKIKTEKRQELVIGGYTINEGTNKLFSALLLGIIEKGKFNFVTPVGTGFNRKMQEEIVKQLKPYITPKSLFSTEPEYNKPSRFRPNPPKAEVVWVKPKLVAEISYRELTPGGAIRQPSFKGLRPDKKPSEVVRELPQSTSHLLKETGFARQKVISAPGKKGRATLLNPAEETQTRSINGHDIKFTSLSKIFWPKEKWTKRDMINYYYQIAPVMLPYMKDRPQIMNRHPHGIAGNSFYQKDVKGKAPGWIETFPYYSFMDQREKEFLVCTNEASLLYLASLGCIEMNPWHSRRQKPGHPDWCIIDLDPDGNPFSEVIETAQVTKKILDEISVPAYCKTSGSTGLHIYIPLGAKYDYEESKEFGRRIAKVVHHELPKFTSIERKTEDREGKLYIDFLMNRPQASVAAPYSLRPKPGATVSMPLHWDEVKKGLKMKDFTIASAVDRVKKEGDLFKPVLGKGIQMKKAIDALENTFASILGKTVQRRSKSKKV